MEKQNKLQQYIGMTKINLKYSVIRKLSYMRNDVLLYERLELVKNVF